MRLTWALALTARLFSVWMLKRRLSNEQWLSLGLLAAGVGVVELSATQAAQGGKVSLPGNGHVMHPLIGFMAVCAACTTSGLAGVYFELVLKVRAAASRTSLTGSRRMRPCRRSVKPPTCGSATCNWPSSASFRPVSPCSHPTSRPRPRHRAAASSPTLASGRGASCSSRSSAAWSRPWSSSTRTSASRSDCQH